MLTYEGDMESVKLRRLLRTLNDPKKFVNKSKTIQ